MGGKVLLLAIAALSCLVSGHPGEHHDHDIVKREMEIRHEIAENQMREVQACEGSFDVVARRERAAARRAETVRRLRIERGIDPNREFLYTKGFSEPGTDQASSNHSPKKSSAVQQSCNQEP